MFANKNKLLFELSAFALCMLFNSCKSHIICTFFFFIPEVHVCYINEMRIADNYTLRVMNIWVASVSVSVCKRCLLYLDISVSDLFWDITCFSKTFFVACNRVNFPILKSTLR